MFSLLIGFTFFPPIGSDSGTEDAVRLENIVTLKAEHVTGTHRDRIPDWEETVIKAEKHEHVVNMAPLSSFDEQPDPGAEGSHAPEKPDESEVSFPFMDKLLAETAVPEESEDPTDPVLGAEVPADDNRLDNEKRSDDEKSDGRKSPDKEITANPGHNADPAPETERTETKKPQAEKIPDQDGKPDQSNKSDPSGKQDKGDRASKTDQKPAQKPAGTRYNPSVERQIVALVNEERAKKGLAPLRVKDELQDYARKWSVQQYRMGGMGHGMTDFPKSEISGQNVAYASGNVNYFGWEKIWSAQETVDGWMNSPEHRANMLRPEYKFVGVGVVYGTKGSDGWVFYTQNFSD